MIVKEKTPIKTLKRDRDNRIKATRTDRYKIVDIGPEEKYLFGLSVQRKVYLEDGKGKMLGWVTEIRSLLTHPTPFKYLVDPFNCIQRGNFVMLQLKEGVITGAHSVMITTNVSVDEVAALTNHCADITNNLAQLREDIDSNQDVFREEFDLYCGIVEEMNDATSTVWSTLNTLCNDSGLELQEWDG